MSTMYSENQPSHARYLASGMFPKIAEDSTWFCSQNGETSFEDILMMFVFYGIDFVFICSLRSRSCTQNDRSWFKEILPLWVEYVSSLWLLV